MSIAISRESTKHPTKAVRADAKALLQALGLAKAELSILLCDDPFIQGLNAQWRGKDEPTDVLSFAMGEGEHAGINPEILGDVVISVETAERQGAALGLTLDEEVRVLLVHGVLHLLGYDHLEPDDEVEMRAKEAELLLQLGGGPICNQKGLVARATEPDAG